MPANPGQAKRRQGKARQGKARPKSNQIKSIINKTRRHNQISAIHFCLIFIHSFISSHAIPPTTTTTTAAKAAVSLRHCRWKSTAVAVGYCPLQHLPRQDPHRLPLPLPPLGEDVAAARDPVIVAGVDVEHMSLRKIRSTRSTNSANANSRLIPTKKNDKVVELEDHDGDVVSNNNKPKDKVVNTTHKEVVSILFNRPV